MFDWKPLPMATQLGKGASEFSQAMELRNLYVQRNPPGSKRPFLIGDTPSLVSPFANTGVLAMASAGTLFFVDATHAYHRDSTIHDIGAIGSSVSGRKVHLVPVGLRSAVLFSEGLGQWLIDTVSIAAITHPDGGGAYFIDAAPLDRRVIYVEGNGSDRWFWSDLDDPDAIDALSFSTADAVPDYLLGVEVCNREIQLFGKRHTEFWYDAGGFPQPYARSPGGVVDIGCFDAATIATLGRTHFLAHDLTVRRFNGYEPERISNEWVERLIKQSAPGMSYVSSGHVHFYAGHSFYGLSIADSVGGNHLNLFFDIDEGAWHRRDGHASDAVKIYTGMVDHATSFSEAPSQPQSTYVIAHGGRIHALSESAYRDDSVAVDKSRIMTCPEQDADGRRVFEAAAEIVMERTTGIAGTAEYEFSDDGGASFQSMGEVSTDAEQKRWVLCGSFAERRIRRLTIEANHRVSIDGFRGLMEVGQ